LSAHAPELRFDFVIVDPQSLPHSEDLAAFLEARGSQLILSEVAMGVGSLQHDPGKLALLLAKIFS